MKLSPLPTLKKIKRPELYFDFYNAKVGKNVRIDGIYFDDKNQLTKDSKIKLEGLVLYLKDYPATTIVIVSYVESSLKKDEEIMNASMQRTNSIKDFLLENKIPEKQIKRSPSALIFNPELSKIPHIEIKMLKK
jgi:outer membrane protein OmpA-like peptidoglycan-associated protein